MNDFLTPYELGLKVNDFDFDLIKIGKDQYDTSGPPFIPYQNSIVKVNGKVFEMETNFVDVDAALEGFNYKQKVIDKVKENQVKSIKIEAILKYVNSNNYIRKIKLEKINKKSGI